VQAREEAERQCREDQQRIAELQGLHRQVEELLELERQAKRDEELVRSLQAKYSLRPCFCSLVKSINQSTNPGFLSG